jgi:hypothetical protein
MKSKRFFIMASFILMSWLIFAGCATAGSGSTSNGEQNPAKFEGTWINEQGIKYIFTDKTWQLIRPGRTDNSGTFTFTDISIRFIAVAGGSGAWSYTYEFKNDDTVLSFTGSNGPAQSTGDFTKQP